MSRYPWTEATISAGALAYRAPPDPDQAQRLRARLALMYFRASSFRKAEAALVDADLRPTGYTLYVAEASWVEPGAVAMAGGQYGMASPLDVTRLKFDAWMARLDGGDP